MDVKKAIEKRRSIRKYQDKEISDDLIKELIDAARLAPSGLNTQPSKYLVVKDSEIKNKLRENGIFSQDFVYQASAIIVCCADPGAYKERSEKFDNPNEIRAIRDLSIASSFLVLRATELGLGTCYVGWINREKIRDILDIPRDYRIPYVITVGYPAEQPESTSRKNIDEILL